MATDKLITMKQFNGTDYDTLYPKTIASQVDGVYNKQEVIKDTTKSMFGYGSSAIPDTIFQWLGKYNQYWWKRRAVGEHTEEVRTEKAPTTRINFAHSKTATRTIQYSDLVTFDSSNNPSLVNPSSVSVSYTNSSTTVPKLLGKYVKNLYASASTIYFVPPTATYHDEQDTEYNEYETYFTSTIYSITGTTVTDKGSWNYLNSSDRSAYPDSGESGGYEYLYLGVPFDNAVNGAKIETGSYVGTGTYGSSSPCSLTFGFSPSVLIISGVLKSKSTSVSGIGSVIMNISYGHYGESYAEYSINGIVEATENQVRWYSDNAASEQMNTLGSNYYYIALG